MIKNVLYATRILMQKFIINIIVPINVKHKILQDYVKNVAKNFKFLKNHLKHYVVLKVVLLHFLIRKNC